ncbi:MAG: asparaginase [Jatrophihabitantaceae bacterium]
MSSALPLLLDVSRDGLVESHHHGSIVLLDASGDVAVTAGVADDAVFARSSLKPLQAVAMLSAGFPGRDEDLTLATASHDAEEVHVAGVRRVLAGAGLAESALQCPPDLPAGREAMLAWVRAGGAPSPVCHNCSGKHAAMLATCVANGWDPGSYRAADHPLQDVIRSAIEVLCGAPIAASAVDGCGAPAHAVSLAGLARAFSRIATAPSGTANALVRDAMQAHPRLVGGSGRAVSELIAAVDGLVCKDGAEGVWGAALADGRAFAAKVDDGAARALPPLLAAALRYWGVDNACVRRWSAVDVLGGGRPVGAVGWSPFLRELLDLDASA